MTGTDMCVCVLSFLCAFYLVSMDFPNLTEELSSQSARVCSKLCYRGVDWFI